MTTAIHRDVDDARAGRNERVIARLDSGWAVLGDPQVLRGYCLLLPDPVVPHLNALDSNGRAKFLRDMTLLGDAVMHVTNCVRINYEMLGNLEPALHAHVVPRYADEPAEHRTKPVWSYDWSKAAKFDVERDAPLIRALADAIKQQKSQQQSLEPDSLRVLVEVKAAFKAQKNLAERAINQLNDEQLRTSLHPDTNSIAVIMKHMAGNMRSRWTDFLTSDGEKPWRNRDEEFIDRFTSRREIVEWWEGGWKRLFHTLEELTADDLARTVTIRGEPQSVIRALLRQLDHYGYHVGQIVQVARILAGEKWTTLSIPRGGSHEYNQRMWQTPASA